jgi:DegV family protein with EDD domain
MAQIQIVTDSTAHFASPGFVQQHNIVVVPNTIQIAGKSYKEGVDLSAEDAMRLCGYEQTIPVVIPPDEAAYAEVYHRLAISGHDILSLHPSRKISASWDQAQRAAIQVAGQCEIAVIDSQTLSAGQAMLVTEAVRAVQTEPDLEAVVRKVRGAIERIYLVLYTDSMQALLHNTIMSTSHLILGTMLGVKPFLTVENGELRPIEKVRTRMQAAEHLIEFVTEFTDIQEIVILQNKVYPTEQTRLLQERLALEFDGQHFPHLLYGPSLTALVGGDALGIVLIEKEIGYLDDGI